MNNQSQAQKERDPYTIFEYLVKKLDYRKSSMTNIRAAVNGIANLEDLVDNKKYMVKHFAEMEDDIKQAAEALKILMLQNKDYSEQLVSHQKRFKQMEHAIVSENNTSKNLEAKIAELERTVENLQEVIVEKDSILTYSNERINTMEREIEEKNQQIEQYSIMNTSYKSKIDSLTDEISILKLEVQRLKEEKGHGANEEYNKRDNPRSGRSEPHSIQDILQEREQTKRLLNEKIKSHLSDEPVQNSDSKQHTFNNSNRSQKVSVDKQELLLGLLERITTSAENIDLLNKVIGRDFMTKLLSSDVDEQFLFRIQEALDRPNARYDQANSHQPNKGYVFDDDYSDMNSNSRRVAPENDQAVHNLNQIPTNATGNSYSNLNNSYKSKLYDNLAPEIAEEKEELEVSGTNFTAKMRETENSQRENLNRSVNRSVNRSFNKSLDSKKNLNRSYSSSVINSKNFEKSLRSYNPSNAGHRKVFMNYTNPYGKYFDGQLQKGGSSKLISSSSMKSLRDRKSVSFDLKRK